MIVSKIHYCGKTGFSYVNNGAFTLAYRKVPNEEFVSAFTIGVKSKDSEIRNELVGGIGKIPISDMILLFHKIISEHGRQSLTD